MVGVVIVAVSVGTAFTVGWYAPTQVALLSQGQMELHVPLMALYTAPNDTGLIESSRASYSFASTAGAESSNLQFSWSLVGNSSLPVEFAMRMPAWTGNAFRSLGGGSFAYYPEGVCAADCTSLRTTTGLGGSGAAVAQTVVWAFNYTVRVMSRLPLFGGAQFLEIDLSPAIGGGAFMGSFDDVGVPFAAEHEMLSLESFTVAPGAGITFSTNASAIHALTFGYSPPPVSVNAGDRGFLSVKLTSAFRWSSVDWESVSFVSGGNITVHEYVDLRFGSINVTVEPYSPYPGP